MSSNYRSLLLEIVNDYYKPFKNKERKVIWLSAFAPSEIITSFDVDIFYPEIYTTILANKEICQKLISLSNQKGYENELCSYMRIFSGALDFEKSLPFGKIPSPDALVVTNNQCGTLFPMWKIFASYYNVPLFILDLPASNTNRRDYIIQQMRELIIFMEKISNSSIDYYRLSENVQISAEVSFNWRKLCNLVFSEEINISLNSLVSNYFTPITIAHSSKKTLEYLSLILSNSKKVSQKDNKKRIYWYGYPCWFSDIKFPDLSNNGAKIVANNYLTWWDFQIDKHDDPIDALTNAYSNTYLNRSFNNKMIELKNELIKFNIDGVFVISNFSCKRDSIMSNKIAETIQKMGYPVSLNEADMCDKTKFNENEFLLRAETFLENL